MTHLHHKYLDGFYEEEFDKPDPVSLTQKRPMVPREKILAYIVRIEGRGLDQSRGVALARTISKAYSGYVHDSSPQIMEMYGGNPPQFHVTGMHGRPLFRLTSTTFGTTFIEEHVYSVLRRRLLGTRHCLTPFNVI